MGEPFGLPSQWLYARWRQKDEIGAVLVFYSLTLLKSPPLLG